jgi:hypothetical protein
MVGYLPLIRKPPFCRRRTAAARTVITGGGRLPPFRGGTGPAAGRRKGFDQAGGGAADGAREGEAPHGAAKGGTGQGKPADGTGRATFTSGGRTARADGAASCPGFDQAGRHGAERGKGKGGRKAARKGKGRGLCGTVERLRTREKKNPACGGACKVNGAAGHYPKGGGGGGGAATGL